MYRRLVSRSDARSYDHGFAMGRELLAAEKSYTARGSMGVDVTENG
jgi:hypothetical protein